MWLEISKGSIKVVNLLNISDSCSVKCLILRLILCVTDSYMHSSTSVHMLLYVTRKMSKLNAFKSNR